MSQPRLTAQIRQRAIAMMRAGHSASDIARTLNLSRTTVVRWKAQAGFPPIHVVYAPEMREQARSLYLDGIRPSAIAELLGCSRSSVTTWVRGLPKQRDRVISAPTLADARRALALLDKGESVASVAAALNVQELIVRRWADQDRAERRAKLPPANDRYRISDPVRALALSGAWR